MGQGHMRDRTIIFSNQKVSFLVAAVSQLCWSASFFVAGVGLSIVCSSWRFLLLSESGASISFHPSADNVRDFQIHRSRPSLLFSCQFHHNIVQCRICINRQEQCSIVLPYTTYQFTVIKNVRICSCRVDHNIIQCKIVVDQY